MHCRDKEPTFTVRTGGIIHTAIYRGRNKCCAYIGYNTSCTYRDVLNVGHRGALCTLLIQGTLIHVFYRRLNICCT